MRSLRYITGAVQDIFDGPGGLTRRHRFCTAVQMEMAFRVTEGLVADFAAREQVSLLDERIMAAILSLDRSSMQTSRLFSIVGEVLEQQSQNFALLASHSMTETDQFTLEPTVWIHQNESSLPGSSIAINPRLRSQSAPPSPIPMDPAAAPTSKPLPQGQPTIQVAANINMNIPPTARESEHLLHRGASRPLVDVVSISFSVNKRILLRELLRAIPNLRHVFKA